MKMSWKDIKGGGEFPLVEPGMYAVRVTSIERCTSSVKKTPQIEVKGVIQDGMDQNVVDYLALTEPALWRVKQAMLAAGMSEETFKALPDCDSEGEEFYRIVSMLKGRVVYWDMIQDTYDGKTKNKVNAWMSYPDAKQDPLEYEDNVPEWVKNKLKK